MLNIDSGYVGVTSNCKKINQTEMKSINIIILLMFVSTFIYGQIFTPGPYESNYSLDFNSFLGGVKSAHVMLNDELAEYITNNPSSSHAQVIGGLLSYLKAIGFEDVKWGSRANLPENFSSLCEVVIVRPSWDQENSTYHTTYTNIGLRFQSCKWDHFSFYATKNIRANTYTNITSSFHNTYMKMYGFRKIPYSIHDRLTLNSEMTEWTEDKLKTRFNEKGADPIEGIYESALGAPFNRKYKLGLVKDTAGYSLIYFSGAKNYLDWKAGEVKAKLYPTATATLFKADWYTGNKFKIANSHPYITFEQGFMNVAMQDGDKTLYVKLYPTASDNFTSTIPGPSSGTGFAVASNGIIATNQHVVNGANTIKVRGINGDFTKLYNAKIITEDKNNDLAIIKIDDNGFTTLGTIPYLISGRSSDVGTSVFVMGYPLRASMGDEIKLTNGIISSKSGFQGDVTSYQISAPVQPGNSGGPLFDGSGNLIGIVKAKHTEAENVSYAIKSSYLLNLFDLVPSAPKLQTISSVKGKTLTEQVKTLKKFTYIIEVN